MKSSIFVDSLVLGGHSAFVFGTFDGEMILEALLRGLEVCSSSIEFSWGCGIGTGEGLARGDGRGISVGRGVDWGNYEIWCGLPVWIGGGWWEDGMMFEPIFRHYWGYRPLIPGNGFSYPLGEGFCGFEKDLRDIHNNNRC